ncbi:hypothetical protein [Phreatobacter stygius]|uniref:Nuclear transport factor 2 family protein n=1 Tax=Phreatobacter stygius TaxID=1940610 RepID=A0A4D7B1I4_9HYPH|nr:hypothetical protein [Phreatobacter stygius]QCI67569.1 hypothetical protein E8M01_27100 [Phreatobacter stygius]
MSQAASNPTPLSPAQAQALAERYVAVWNEKNPAARRRQIAELWAPKGEHFVKTREVRGYEALEARVTGSHETNVVSKNQHFRVVANAQALQDTITFNWEMVANGTGEVTAVGLEFLHLDGAGRILVDYQFMVA